MTTSKFPTIFFALMIAVLIFMFIIHIATENWRKIQQMDTRVSDHTTNILKSNIPPHKQAISVEMRLLNVDLPDSSYD